MALRLLLKKANHAIDPALKIAALVDGPFISRRNLNEMSSPAFYCAKSKDDFSYEAGPLII